MEVGSQLALYESVECRVICVFLGAFPEIHVAQYPLNMGRGEDTSTSLAVQLDASGKVKYDVLARQGQGKDKIVYSKYTDLLPVEVIILTITALQ